jgi:hypothetical protein
MNMEFESTITRKQYFNAQWRSILFAIVFTVVLGMMVVFLIGLVIKGSFFIKGLWISIPLGILLFYIFVYTNIFTSKDNKRRLFARRKFVIDEKAITVSAAEYQMSEPWETFTLWNESKCMVIILSKSKDKNNHSLTIPKVDLTEAQYSELITLLNTKIGLLGRVRKQ